MNSLLVFAKICFALLTLGLVASTVWSVATGQVALLSLTLGMLSLGFGYFVFNDIKKLLGK